jgi:ACS family hexuronate transporter-like MFS transporter
VSEQLLAALAPRLMAEFRITAAQYGDVIFVFSICYALAAPLVGLLVDRIGLRLGAALAVGTWSMAGLATGLTTTLGQLTLARAALGMGEGGGVPSTGKAAAVWLKPGERALGSALTQAGLSMGAIAAPVLAEVCARAWGWRSAFVVGGALGVAWLPLWWTASRVAPWRGDEAARPEGEAGAVGAARNWSSDPSTGASPSRGVANCVGPALPSGRGLTGKNSGRGMMPAGAILRDPRYVAVLVANVLTMLVYSLWVNWTTVFLVRVLGLDQRTANLRLAWIPPVFASAGGFAGGWLALVWSRRMPIVRARLHAVAVASVLMLATALVPAAGTPALATALISISFFACVLGSVNIYSLPIDLYGAGRAGFAVAGLTGVYGLLQGAFSAITGRAVEAHGFAPVCWVVASCPLAAWALLRVALRRETRA